MRRGLPECQAGCRTPRHSCPSSPRSPGRADGETEAPRVTAPAAVRAQKRFNLCGPGGQLVGGASVGPPAQPPAGSGHALPPGASEPTPGLGDAQLPWTMPALALGSHFRPSGLRVLLTPHGGDMGAGPLGGGGEWRRVAVTRAAAVTAPPRPHGLLTSEAWRLHVHVFWLTAVGVSNDVFWPVFISEKFSSAMSGVFSFTSCLLARPCATVSSSRESLSVPSLVWCAFLKPASGP